MPKACASCGEVLSKAAFSKNQWPKSDEARRCKNCTAGPPKKKARREGDKDGPPELLPAAPTRSASHLLKPIRDDSELFTLTKSGQLQRSSAEFVMDVKFPKGCALNIDQINELFKDFFGGGPPPVPVLVHARLKGPNYWVPIDVGTSADAVADACAPKDHYSEEEEGEGEGEEADDNGRENEDAYDYSDDGEHEFDALCCSALLVSDCARNPGMAEAADSTDLDSVLAALTTRASTIQASVSTRQTPTEAVGKIEGLVELIEEMSDPVQILLRAEGGTFAPVARELWDALVGLGLDWNSDGNCFMWGHDGFVVETMTHPVLDPEAMANSAWDNGYIVLQFMMPITCCPLQVFDAMVSAADYIQSRVGGELQGGDGVKFDRQSTRKSLRKKVGKMNAAGISPGDLISYAVF